MYTYDNISCFYCIYVQILKKLFVNDEIIKSLKLNPSSFLKNVKNLSFINMLKLSLKLRINKFGKTQLKYYKS